MAVITISRQSGSEGNEVTRLLCARLGYQYFDKNMMAQMAQEIGLSADQIIDASVDQHQAKGWLERTFGNIQLPFGDPDAWTLAAKQDALEAASVEHVRDLINVAYEKGNVVIVGRGGQMVLAGKPDVLHVRIVAPLETRIQRWQAREGLSHEEASKKVHERDSAHSDFIQRFFDTDINDAARYDLVINTVKVTPLAAVDLIIKALGLLQGKV